MIFCADILDWALSYDGPPSHALLSDAPYELGFMNRAWDKSGIAFNPEMWAAVGKHLLPGAFIAVFGGSRTSHRLTCAIEDAGFLIHPAIGWAYGSGFPKATRIRTGEETDTGQTETLSDFRSGSAHAARDTSKFYTRPVMEAHGTQKVWEGHRYGLQAMKPALESICIAQKPYDGKPLQIILSTGAGALNVDGTRIGTNGELVEHRGAGGLISHIRDEKPYPNSREGEASAERRYAEKGVTDFAATPGRRTEFIKDSYGRWPANLVLTHSPDCLLYFKDKDSLGEPVESKCVDDCPVKALDNQSGPSGAFAPVTGLEPSNSTVNVYKPRDRCETVFHGDEGTASRFFHRSHWEFEKADPFFYAAKASFDEREAGLFGIAPCHKCGGLRTLTHKVEGRDVICRRNAHPTVKPIALTKYLATLLLPPKEYGPRRLLVPFSGVASEMSGAALAGWEEVVGVDSDPGSVDVAEKRFDYWKRQHQPELFQ